MPYYKFLHARDVCHVMSGSIRLGNLQYYRLLEILTQNDFIGDIREGQRDHPFEDSLDGPIKMMNCTGVSQATGFAFCYSEGPYDKLNAEFSKARPGVEAYDSCIEIMDPHDLTHALMIGECNGKYAGKALSDLGDVENRRVEYYDDRQIKPGEKVANANGFQKDIKYIDQAECRILLGLHAREDYIGVQVAGAEALFRIVHVGDPARGTGTVSADGAWSDMRACLTEASKDAATNPRFDNTGKWSAREEEFAKWDDWFIRQVNARWRDRLYSAYALTRNERPCDRLDRWIINGQNGNQVYRDFVAYEARDQGLFFDQPE